jgi:hypothetical protein
MAVLGMTAPPRFTRPWREKAENGRPITRGTFAESRRSRQNASIALATVATERYPVPETVRAAPVVSLRSPSGLAPREGLQPATNHRLSQRVER